jgi:hypothetical protein
VAELYNPLQLPSAASENRISVYLSEVIWVSDTSLLTLTVGILTDADDVTSFGLRLHYNASQVSYTSDTNYSLLQTSSDTTGQGIDAILASGIVSGSGHVQVSDATSNFDGEADTDSFVKANWASTWNGTAMEPWPGSTNVELYQINFTVTDTSSGILFGFSADANDLKEGYSLSEVSSGDFRVDLTLSAAEVEGNLVVRYLDSDSNSTTLGNQSLVFVDPGSDNTTVDVTSGTLDELSASISFDHVEMASSSYDDGIAISDAVKVLKQIVGLESLSGASLVAADANLDGGVTISDAVSILKHIVGLDSIVECALLDSSGNLVEGLTSSSTGAYTLVQYGDADLSGTFEII